MITITEDDLISAGIVIIFVLSLASIIICVAKCCCPSDRRALYFELKEDDKISLTVIKKEKSTNPFEEV